MFWGGKGKQQTPKWCGDIGREAERVELCMCVRVWGVQGKVFPKLRKRTSTARLVDQEGNGEDQIAADYVFRIAPHMLTDVHIQSHTHTQTHTHMQSIQTVHFHQEAS